MRAIRRATAALACGGGILALAACTLLPPQVQADPTPTSFAISPFLVTAALEPDGSGVAASGYVEGVIESDTECTFVFASTGSEFTEITSSVADAANTSCGSVLVPTDRFTSGQWTVELRYETAGTTYASQAIPLEIP